MQSLSKNLPEEILSADYLPVPLNSIYPPLPRGYYWTPDTQKTACGATFVEEAGGGVIMT